LDILEYYEPYGQKNPKPHFLVEDVVVQSHKLLGAQQTHQKIVVQKDSTTIDSIDFNFETKVTKGQSIKFSCVVSKNEFRGSVSAQLIVDELIFD
jgi:single-stranded-DNA-specific exonuclease